MAEGHKSKVRFPEDQIIEDESTSIVGKVSGDKIRISLGFLQFHHRYHINLRIDHFLGDELASDPSLNPNVQLLESNLNETGKGHELLISVKVTTDVHLEEVLVITNSKKKAYTCTIDAQVLGINKGRPTLRNGIHCVEHCEDEKEFPSK